MHRTLSRTTITLHWLVAGAFISLLILGLLMKHNELLSLYPIHKSLGILSLLLILPRVIWRLNKGWPTPLTTWQATERKLAKITHWVLILGTLLMPISGMMASGASGHGFGVFSLTFIPAHHSPQNPNEIVPYYEWLANLGYGLHTWVGFALVGAIVLHLLGALKHQLLDKDSTLLRMLGRA